MKKGVKKNLTALAGVIFIVVGFFTSIASAIKGLITLTIIMALVLVVGLVFLAVAFGE